MDVYVSIKHGEKFIIICLFPFNRSTLDSRIEIDAGKFIRVRNFVKGMIPFRVTQNRKLVAMATPHKPTYTSLPHSIILNHAC